MLDKPRNEESVIKLKKNHVLNLIVKVQAVATQVSVYRLVQNDNVSVLCIAVICFYLPANIDCFYHNLYVSLLPF